jgi:2-oxoisovalerate dehydrogenase E1 component
MAHTISELAFDELDAPPVVVGSRNWIVPAHELENHFFPQTGWILDAIHMKIVPLDGHIPGTDFSDEIIRQRNMKGI